MEAGQRRGVGGGSIAGADRKASVDDGRAHGEWLGGVDEFLSRQVGRGERVVSEFAQDVVGAPAEFARNRETGAVVVDPLGDLQVVGMVG